ncbi:hypothetical protein BKP35_10850 [Anaerobacillus arseniciselenatis]|uniref:Methyl-accepting chemotaxis protein n=1 Tax=Anaerobacillus arseniciselenatis TaxID=85682 RepID=A0A1S2LLI2_9BACI|nr:methyl-accepting chemotaxis protein [Anaerobacillus arseniciselenatis]OIJ12295.1 hypothetical protein BKP35_10850 [Anaerobacillus arseniciselenatis]
MKSSIKPVKYVLNKLTFFQKFISIFIIIFIPISIITFLYIDGMMEDIRVSESERNGLVYIEEIRSIVQYTQQHRGLSSGYLSGDEAVAGAINERQEDINQLYNNIEHLINDDNDRYSIREDFQYVKDQWNSITTNLFSYIAPEAIELHNNLMIDIFDFAATIAGESSLFLDYDLVNYHMVVLVVDRLPLITELMGQSRAVGTGIATRGNINDEENFQLSQLKQSLENQVHNVERSIEAIYREDNSLYQLLSEQSSVAIENVNILIEKLETEFLNSNSIAINPNDYFDFTTDAIDGYYEFLQLNAQLLDERLVERISDLKSSRNTITVILAITMILLAYIFIAFYTAIKDNIIEVEQASSRIAEGDLTQSVKIMTRDEMKDISNSLNHMTLSIKNLVQSNQSVAHELTASSQELSMVTEDTAKASEQITYSIEGITRVIEDQLIAAQEIDQSINELASGLNVVIETSNDVVQSSHNTSEEAQNGSQLVTNTINQMNTISQSIDTSFAVIEELDKKSKSIGEIIDVITGIAEQTNLLALNAAIEAARAGENGKGFSVVADEVRKLAEESARSSKNIYQLIQEVQSDTERAKSSMEKVLADAKEGINVVNMTGEGFEKIVSATSSVEQQVSEVSSLALKMSGSIEKVVANVKETTKSAHQCEENAHKIAASSEEQLASMEEITSSVHTLNERAQDLQDSVDKFKVDA